MFKVESFAFRGPVIWGQESKATTNSPTTSSTSRSRSYIKEFPPVTGGWLAGMQHHFASAIVPDANKPYEYLAERRRVANTFSARSARRRPWLRARAC